MKKKIAVIGLGYTGAPLAFSFSKKFAVVGYDLNKKRIKNLNKNIDENKQISFKEFKNSKSNIILTVNPNYLKSCNIYIVAVPTPVNKKKLPDLSILISATKTAARYLKTGDYVIYDPRYIQESLMIYVYLFCKNLD